jgi:hypothetical protein
MNAGLPGEITIATLDVEGEFARDDHLLARYSADGGLEWVHLLGSVEAHEEEYRSLGVRPSGEIVVAGDMGPGEVVVDDSSGLIVDLGDDSRVLVGVISSAGELAWATVYGSEYFDAGWGVALLDDGDVIVLGLTGGATVFGFPGAETTVSDEGVWVVARIDGLEPTPLATTPEPTATTAVRAEPSPTEPGTADEGGGGMLAIVVVVLVVLGAGVVVVVRQRKA